MDYGAIITPSPRMVSSLGTLNLSVSAHYGFRFISGQTYVTYRTPGATAQLTVTPAGVTHASEHGITAHVPDMSPGTYECLVTSGADLARTVVPITHRGKQGAGPSAPRSYGIALDAPQPQAAYANDTVSLRVLPGSAFRFHSTANFLSFGAPGGQARFTLQPGGIRRLADDHIEFELPTLPPGTYAIVASSGGSDAQARMPIVHRGNAPFGHRPSALGGGASGIAMSQRGRQSTVPLIQPVAGSFTLAQPLPTVWATATRSTFIGQGTAPVMKVPVPRPTRSPIAAINKRTLGAGQFVTVAHGASSTPTAGTTTPSPPPAPAPFGAPSSGPTHDPAGMPPAHLIPHGVESPPVKDPKRPVDPGPDPDVPTWSELEASPAGPEPEPAFPEAPDPYATP